MEDSLLTKNLFINFCHFINQMTFSDAFEGFRLIKDYFNRFGYDIQYHSEIYEDDVEDQGSIQYDFLYVRPIHQSHHVFVYQMMIGTENNQTIFSFRPYLGEGQIICC